MNNDIKEILDKLKDSVDNPIVTTFSYDGTDDWPIDNDLLLEPEDCKVLLDYITNLQEENEDIKSKCKKAIRIIDKFKENYIICFDKVLWEFVKRLEKCLLGSDKNV